jgi:hypothetical protein
MENELEMSGIEPEAFRMRNGRSTTELHPPVNMLNFNLILNPVLVFWGLNFKKFLQIKLFGHEEHQRYCSLCSCIVRVHMNFVLFKAVHNCLQYIKYT